jgi:hypothetical protein
MSIRLLKAALVAGVAANGPLGAQSAEPGPTPSPTYLERF